MLKCINCNVNIAGNKICCPLCQGDLIGTPEPQTEVFPMIKTNEFDSKFILKILSLICIVVSTICVFLNTQIASYVYWSVFVIFGSLCIWITCAVSIRYKKDIVQNISFQVILVPIMSILWDFGTGFNGWSIEFVLPCVCIAGMLALFVLFIFLKNSFHSCVLAFIVTCIIGIIPLLLYIFGKIKIVYPTFLCSGISIITISWLLIFKWKIVFSEISRRFHI